jgi:hypothetical protein
VQTDRIVLRPRPQSEAIDLGFQLARASWPRLIGVALAILGCLMPVAAAAAAIAPPLALLVFWWFKPTLDRALLHVLASDLTGRTSSVRTTLGQRRRWWSGGHLASLTVLRFHPSRSARLPIWQLEGLSGSSRRQRVRALAHGDRGGGLLLTFAAIVAEWSLFLSLAIMFGWLLPTDLTNALSLTDGTGLNFDSAATWAGLALIYVLTVALVEPFYVAGGFGLYLNQRCRLECWDLQPVLRRIGQRHAGASAA